MKAVSEERSFLWRFGGVKVDNHNVVDKGANMAHGHQRCCDMVSTLLVGLGGQVQPLVSCYVCRPRTVLSQCLQCTSTKAYHMFIWQKLKINPWKAAEHLILRWMQMWLHHGREISWYGSWRKTSGHSAPLSRRSFFANLANILQLNKHDKKIGTSNMFSGIFNMGIIAYDLKPCKETFGVHFSN